MTTEKKSNRAVKTRFFNRWRSTCSQDNIEALRNRVEILNQLLQNTRDEMQQDAFIFQQHQKEVEQKLIKYQMAVGQINRK